MYCNKEKTNEKMLHSENAFEMRGFLKMHHDSSYSFYRKRQKYYRARHFIMYQLQSNNIAHKPLYVC